MVFESPLSKKHNASLQFSETNIPE